MLKGFRKTLHDRLGYALAGLDWKDRPTPVEESDHGPHPIQGLFRPIFERYVSIERRAPSTLRTLIDEALLKAGCMTPTNSSLLNLNLTVYSVLLLLEAGADVHSVPLPADLIRLIERECEVVIRRSATVNLKGSLSELIGNTTDRHAFATHYASPTARASADDLFYSRATVISFLASLRSETFRAVASESKRLDGLFMWRWSYARGLDKNFMRLQQEIHGLVEAVRKDTLALYGIEAKPTPDEAILPCPSCTRRIRFALPPKALIGRCGACKQTFEVVIDAHTVTLKSVVEPSKPRQQGLAIQEALAVLGLAGEPSRAELKAAFRKRMSEYHPDKVSTLGPKIKALAEQECKEINSAMDTLRQAGMID